MKLSTDQLNALFTYIDRAIELSEAQQDAQCPGSSRTSSTKTEQNAKSRAKKALRDALEDPGWDGPTYRG